MTDGAVERDVALVGRIPAVPTILQVVTRTTGLRFAAVARVTDRTWTACAVHDLIDFGLKPGGELELETTICNEIRQHHQPVVFGQASTHPHFSTHHTPKLYGLESYISVPIFRGDGSFFGTLCAIDPLPAKLDDPNVVETLKLFAQLIATQLDVAERIERHDLALIDAAEAARLREQFIAVLGHDLRNPLGAITLGAQLLKGSVEPRLQPTVDRILRSCNRMGELIGNVLDLARGRLGGGIPVTRELDGELGAELLQVVSEVRAAHPGRMVTMDLDLAGPVLCDRRRLAQLLTNLLVNAVTHGERAQPVQVAAAARGGVFELSVTNRGAPIPLEQQARLFQPFTRSTQETSAAGLGLGLYIAAEIARAHSGTLAVTSTAESGTRFTFRMPIPGG